MSVCCFSFFLHLSLLFKNSSFLSDKIVLFWALAPRSVLEQVVGEELRFACQCSIWFARVDRRCPFWRAWFRWECAFGSWSMNLRADMCGFVSKAFQPSERNGAMVSIV